MAAVRPLREVLIFDPEREKAEKLAERISRDPDIESPCRTASSPKETAENSRIIVTVTTSPEPVFHGNDLAPGTHVTAVGSYKPHIREVDDETIQKAKVFVDVKEAALQEAGDLIIPLNSGLITPGHILGELGELVTGKIQGRNRDDELTFFKSVGMAAEDIRTAAWLADRAGALNRGRLIR
jgi:ornithine cyclodeaminase